MKYHKLSDIWYWIKELFFVSAEVSLPKYGFHLSRNPTPVYMYSLVITVGDKVFPSEMQQVFRGDKFPGHVLRKQDCHG